MNHLRLGGFPRWFLSSGARITANRPCTKLLIHALGQSLTHDSSSTDDQSSPLSNPQSYIYIHSQIHLNFFSHQAPQSRQPISTNSSQQTERHFYQHSRPRTSQLSPTQVPLTTPINKRLTIPTCRTSTSANALGISLTILNPPARDLATITSLELPTLRSRRLLHNVMVRTDPSG